LLGVDVLVKIFAAKDSEGDDLRFLNTDEVYRGWITLMSLLAVEEM